MDQKELRVNRSKLVEWSRSQLTGTYLKPGDYLVGEKPLNRFFTGFLFPLGNETLETETYDDYDEDTDSQSIKNTQEKQRYLPPSSAGFSFFVSGESIYLRVFYNAVHFELVNERDEYNQKWTETNKQRWQCIRLANDEGEEVEFHSTDISKNLFTERRSIFGGLARIEALWRKHRHGYIVTITLTNSQLLSTKKTEIERLNEENARSLFQIEFKCIVESGLVEKYPSQERSLLTPEEQELELRYKDSLIYGVGHGVAVNWGRNNQNKMELWSDFLPSVEVPQVTADTSSKDSKVLDFDFLKECNENDSVIPMLQEFIKNYEDWIEKQRASIENEDEADQAIAHQVIDKMNIAKKRMLTGLDVLKCDEKARVAFSIMNEAMLLQMSANDRFSGKLEPKKNYKWRPFQIAFVLMVLESTINENSEFREEVDLIWFPTGGGKTEAYLGVMAFLFIYRRLIYPSSSGGTVAIMRYTLRLLTTQQFLRACKVVSALELIRQRNSNELGYQPISIGLWLGGASSPNTVFQAQEYKNKQDYSKFVLTQCPWCATEFDDKNYQIDADEFYFTCTNTNCDFGCQPNNILPYNVVDESLYSKPPSLLIATVDKFARVAWEEKAASFFGQKNNRPPELIIQDELHLISSALGSIVGMYETGIDTILKSKGVHAKYIASTATIKNAAKQVKSLFARDMQLFPPSGLRITDSYFAKTVPVNEKSGRQYVGYLAPKLSKNRCMEPLAATLSCAPKTLFNDSGNQDFLDSWWTQVVYHGSLKGVNNSYTAFQNGVKSFLINLTKENLYRELQAEPDWTTSQNNNGNEIQFDNLLGKSKKEILNILNKNKVSPDQISIFLKYLPVRELEIGSLTSKRTANETTQIFEALSKQIDENLQGATDVVLATNMISVGLDVSRLALMVINGQPLTTAEYIQASSRVGRGEVPGIVFINYFKTQARSLSHYENFRAYHDSFYRFVEPSSITPFTHQVCKRALHAALIIALRFSDIGLLENNKAGHMNLESKEVKSVIRTFKKRIKDAIQQGSRITDQEKSKLNKVEKLVDELLEQWRSEIEFNEYSNLVYNSKDRGTSNLICNFEESEGNGIPWPTLQSMRNVENVALTRLIPGVKNQNA